MSYFYLIRHGSTDVAGHILTGRSAGVHLNEQGRKQILGLPERFKNVPLQAIYATPLERTQETAEPLAQAFGLTVQIAHEMTEVDYGEWTGRKVDDFRDDPLWHRYVSSRSFVTIPGGESVLQIQERVVRFMGALHRTQPEAHVALVSHGDPIKTAVCFYMGLPLDLFFRFAITPSSVTVVRVTDADACVVTLNNRHDRLDEHTGSL
jgi:probable phosphoglycerate mutase